MNRVKLLSKVLQAVVVFLLTSTWGFTQSPSIKLIKAGNIIDTKNGTTLSNRMILIENDTIKEISEVIKFGASGGVLYKNLIEE